MTDPSDVDLVRRLGSGGRAERERAFTTLFERHRQRSFDLAWRVLGDAGLAADAVQEAFLTVYRKGPRFEERAQFTSWLYRVVLNHAIDLRRRERRHRVGQLPGFGVGRGTRSESGADPSEATIEQAGTAATPEAEAIRAERSRTVRTAIERLSPKLSAVIVLRYPEGLSYEEIGEILGLPPGTVRSRLNRAHAALRDILGDALDEA
jgi:RNA polymerase sigma-70 factor (ECF subfamily)